MKKVVGSILVSLVLMTPFSTLASPFSDDLSKCIIKSTSKVDKNLMVRWIYAAMSMHPEVGYLSKVSVYEANQLNRETAEFMVDLLFFRCGEETVAVVDYEGSQALETVVGSTFEFVGGQAMEVLMTHPDVLAYMSGLERHVGKIIDDASEAAEDEET